jgi:alginate O-acetyltransferase complex protein AlgI
MLFSSISFLYYFLPLLLFCYFIVPNKWKNIVLLISSLFFYFYGEQLHIWVLLLSCFMNYLLGIVVEKSNHKKVILVITVAMNLGLLGYFKYVDFFIDNMNTIFQTEFGLLKVVMPIGISFFTFQTLSYVVDVYRGTVKANKNFLDFATYVCLFPQLVAGPIVRYKDVAEELQSRKHTMTDFERGIRRFVIGLAKKVLLANVIGELSVILLEANEASMVGFWVIALSYTLQIYFDFSGYSDMAIGLGNMFGFHFLENFNYPLIAKSVTDFWRRWHISLSSWFRDYVYIPLGGNRVSNGKWIRNILVVWFLTGFWHGAAWNFIIWGIYFAILLVLEKKIYGKFLEKHRTFGHFYTVFLILISFVIFNVSSVNDGILFFKNMFGLGGLPFVTVETSYYIRSYIVVLVIALIASTPILTNMLHKLKQKKGLNLFLNGIEPFYYVALLLIVTAFLIDSSFNPFLYFRF